MPEDEKPDEKTGENKDAPGTGEQQVVPLAVLQEERKARQKLAKQLEKLEAEAEERRKAEMTEKERAEAEAKEWRDKYERAEKQRLMDARTVRIREEAAKANFADPSDAVAFLSGRVEELEDDAAIAAAVKELADSKKHLLKQPERPGVVGSGFIQPPDNASGGEPEDRVTQGFRALLSRQ